jgi:mannose-6-phosphate isomerase-like protein (cupin superfamily)
MGPSTVGDGLPPASSRVRAFPAQRSVEQVGNPPTVNQVDFLMQTAYLHMVNDVDHMVRGRPGEVALMPVIPAPATPTHELDGTRFTSLATPSRGTRDTAVWAVEIQPRTPPTPHSLTREEIFVVLDGRASVEVDGVRTAARAGDAVVIPPDTEFTLANDADGPLRLLCCQAVGGQARMPGGTPFTPPWAE